jgi:hypothetical protein
MFRDVILGYTHDDSLCLLAPDPIVERVGI